MGITMKIHNIKSLSDFTFEIPTAKGLYALTGENAAGKSTVISCIATAFYSPLLYSYFGEPYNGSNIEFTYGEKKRFVKSQNNHWFAPKGSLGISGFFEGSLVFGNRFKDIDFSLLKKLPKISENKLDIASPFIKENLGLILHDDKSFYQELFLTKKDAGTEYGLQRPTFYYKKNGKFVNQLNMSTGENLLLTILYSMELRLKKRGKGQEASFILLDEIELALHSSALRRLIHFLDRLSQDNNFVVLFSTHSIELIRSIPPENIYYLQRHIDGSIELVNPCYPVYATRNLESSNYGHDYIIMVEDDLAKQIVERILRQKKLLGNKRVLVIAVGGWTQVLRFAYDTIRSNLMLKTTKILIILDRDIKADVPKFLKDQHINFSVEPNYLPIQSLEKYLLNRLTQQVDHALFRHLNDYIFQGKSLSDVVGEYDRKVKNGEYKEEEKIKNGKYFYDSLRHEIHQIRKSEAELIEVTVEYLFSNENAEIKELTQFLEKELATTR